MTLELIQIFLKKKREEIVEEMDSAIDRLQKANKAKREGDEEDDSVLVMTRDDLARAHGKLGLLNRIEREIPDVISPTEKQ